MKMMTCSTSDSFAQLPDPTPVTDSNAFFAPQPASTDAEATLAPAAAVIFSSSLREILLGEFKLSTSWGLALPGHSGVSSPSKQVSGTLPLALDRVCRLRR